MDITKSPDTILTSDDWIAYRSLIQTQLRKAVYRSRLPSDEERKKYIKIRASIRVLNDLFRNKNYLETRIRHKDYYKSVSDKKADHWDARIGVEATNKIIIDIITLLQDEIFYVMLSA